MLQWRVSFQILSHISLCHLSLFFSVHFIAHHKNRKFLRLLDSALIYKAFSPPFDMLECLFLMKFYFKIGDIVNDNTAICSSIEHVSHAIESFLACSIPNLHGYFFSLIHDALHDNIGTNCSFMALRKLLINKPKILKILYEWRRDVLPTLN